MLINLNKYNIHDTFFMFQCKLHTITKKLEASILLNNENFFFIRDENDCTILTYLLIKKKFQCITQLCELTKRNIDFGSFWRLYFSFLHNKNFFLCKWIFFVSKYNPVYLNEKNHHGNTPLIQSIIDNHLISEIIINSNCNFDATNTVGHNCLYIAVLLNKYELVKKMVKNHCFSDIFHMFLCSYILQHEQIYNIFLEKILEKDCLFCHIQQHNLGYHTSLIEKYKKAIVKKHIFQILYNSKQRKKKKVLQKVLNKFDIYTFQIILNFWGYKEKSMIFYCDCIKSC
jgi:ankyrin repeat protein